MTFPAPDDWDWLTPVTLAAEQPIAEFVINHASAELFVFQPLRDFRFCFDGREAVQEIRINRDAIADVTNGFLAAGSLHYFTDRQIEFVRELEIASVVPGHGHDGPGAVRGQDVIRDPDRDVFVIGGIDGES